MDATNRARRLRARRHVALLVAFGLVFAACSGGGDEKTTQGRDFIKPDATEDADVGASTRAAGPGRPDVTTPRSGKAGGAGGSGQAAETPDPSSVSGAGSSSSEGGGATYEGVTDDTIRVVYFWTASQTENNPFLDAIPGANANEARAARAWVKYVNENAARGATVMGFPFNLHGRKLELTVVDAGDYGNPEAQRAAAEKIVKEIKPFVTFANAGVTSARICPFLAAAKMLQVGVADLDFDLNSRTDGYCIPAIQAFNKQFEAARSYLVNRMDETPYSGPEAPAGSAERTYGFVYSEFPDQVNSAPIVVRRLKEAGLPIVKVISVSGDLSTQQQQAPNVVAQLRAAGVNTILPQDALIPLTVGQAADGQGYYPDWFIWPCSGADFTALAHLYSQTQWQRASGVTCTDPHFSPDLVQDDESRDSEWYRQYQTVDQTSEPPAQAPLIYAHLHTILVGITNAGPNLTPETFLGGLENYQPVRYSFRTGRTMDGRNMFIGLNERRVHSMIADVAIIRWDPARRRSGSRFPGAYEFLEDGRRFLPSEL